MPAERLLPLVTLDILVILSTARLLGVALRAIGQPQVMGEVLGGLVLGPSLLGWAAPGLSSALFPPEVLPLLEVLSQYGIVFFMFLVGLELDPALVRGRGRVAVLTAVASIVVPFTLGFLLADRLHPSYAPAGVPRVTFAVFLGTALSVTAFPVLARILIERDLLRTPIGPLAVVCAAANDVAAWCLLAAVVAAARSASVADAARTMGLVGLYVGATITLARPVLTRLAAMAARSGRLSQNLVAVVFVLVLASALATEALGVHAVFGAFLFGAILPKDAFFTRELVDKIEDFAVVLLLPVYFAYTGLRTSLGLVATPDAWLACLLVIVVATVGKVGGAALAARAAGLGGREAVALGVLMNTRGLMELVLLNIGLDLGVVSPELFAMLVAMTVVTTLATAPAIAALYPPHRFRAELAAAPGGSAAVLVPIALPRSGPLMLDVAAALAPAADAPLYLLHLARPPERGALGAGGSPADDDTLAPTLAHAAARGLHVRPLAFVSPRPADDIRDVARAKGAALVVMGWHKAVWSQTVLGGTVHAVMRQVTADVAVLIDRGLEWPPRRVLVPFIGGFHDRAALRLAMRAARRQGVTLTVLAVLRPGAVAPVLDLATPAPAVRVVETDAPVAAVIAEAAAHDLTVLGVGEGWALEPHLFGLRSVPIVARCPSSLLVVRGRAEGERAPE